MKDAKQETLFPRPAGNRTNAFCPTLDHAYCRIAARWSLMSHPQTIIGLDTGRMALIASNKRQSPLEEPLLLVA